MSKEAMDWVLEFAPPMPSQLIPTLAGLARHADKHGRGTYPSVARLAAYACKSERSVQRDLKELRTLAFIRYGDQSKAAHLPEGKRPDVYDLALERRIEGGRAGKDEATLASRVTLTSSRRRGGRKKPSSDEFPDQGTGDVDVTPDVDVTSDADVVDGVTWASQEGRRGRHPNQKKNLNDEPKDSSSAAKLQDEDDLTAFGAFWLTYPKRRNKQEAIDAWRAAIARGATPERMVAAAGAYARERHGQDPQYTKFPATWLNKGCYDDEPDEAPSAGRPNLHAVKGTGHQPFQPPADTSVYANGF